MKKKLFMFLLLGVLLVPGIVNVSADEINKFYTNADEKVVLEDDVIGESALAGTVVDVLGNIDGIGFLAGDTVNQKGNVEYGFIAGNTVNISGLVEKSLFVAGTTINLKQTTNVGRDIYAFGETININGKLGRHVNLNATNLVIEDNTIINGDVYVEAMNITIKDNVVIHGTLNYNEDASIKISENGTIVPSIEKYSNIQEEQGFDVNTLLSSMINLVIVFLIIVIVVPKAINKTEDIYRNANIHKFIKSIGFGFILYLCIPIVCLLLLLSNIGISLGLILLALFIISIYLSCIFAGFVFGNLILVKLLNLKSNKYLSGIIGILLIKLLTFIPVIGTFITFICGTVGMAIIWRLVIDNNDKEDVNNANILNNSFKEDVVIKKEKTTEKELSPVVEPLKKEKVKTTSTKKSTPKATATKKSTTKKESTATKSTSAKKTTSTKKNTTKKPTSKKEDK